MTDIEKLRVLLPHWREHNVSHADDYRARIERLPRRRRAATRLSTWPQWSRSWPESTTIWMR